MERVTLRPTTPEDEPFLYRVYEGTRTDELACLPWTEEEKESFLKMQFCAQRDHYLTTFPSAQFLVILHDEHPAGRLYLDRREDEIRIVDIALLPRYRNSGIGTKLLRDVLKEAAESGRCVRIHVERFNPALRLYRRLGFLPLEDRGPYVLMEWRPDARVPTKKSDQLNTAS